MYNSILLLKDKFKKPCLKYFKQENTHNNKAIFQQEKCVHFINKCPIFIDVSRGIRLKIFKYKLFFFFFFLTFSTVQGLSKTSTFSDVKFTIVLELIDITSNTKTNNC